MLFNLAFRIEAIILVEFGLFSIRVKKYDEDTNPIWLRANFDMIKISRKRAAVRMATYQQRIARYYNA